VISGLVGKIEGAVCVKRYKCKIPPLRITGGRTMYATVNKYLDEWEQACGGKIYVLTDLFGERTRIYIEECFKHWSSSETPGELSPDYSETDIAYRLSLLPCVREALTELPHEPVLNPETGNWEVEARVPRPRNPQSNEIEVIKMVIAHSDRAGWHLRTYHPYRDTIGKKK
jgi:hypothetical protein